MPGYSNDFVAWAIASGANILDVPDYQAAVIRQQGAQVGIADPLTFNNSMRQATSIAAIVAQFTADYGPGNVQDNGDLATLEAQFIAALTHLIETLTTGDTSSFYHFGGADSGSSGHYVLTAPSPTIDSLVTGTTVIFKPGHDSVGGDDLNVAGTGAKQIVREDGSAIQPLDITAAGFPLVAYDGVHWVLIAVLQTVAGVPVATRVAYGIARWATDAEMAAGVTTGSSPAFVSPEGLPMFAEPRWTSVFRGASHVETAYNELVNLTGGTPSLTLTLKTPVGTALAYVINNESSQTWNVAPGAGGFSGQSDIIDTSGGFLTVPSRMAVFLRSDTNNWCVIATGSAASTSFRGVVRLANDTEGTTGVTTGSQPAAMTPERVALFFNAHVATTGARGIARQATDAEVIGGATTGSAPAFVTPDQLSLGGPFVTTGIGAVIMMATVVTTSGSVDVENIINTTGPITSSSGGPGGSFYHGFNTGFTVPGWGHVFVEGNDWRWLTSSSVPGTWQLITASIAQSVVTTPSFQDVNHITALLRRIA